LDPLPVCVGSVIDIPFFSVGVFNPNNAYVCQLSEPDGTFSATPLIVGSSPDPSTYDPVLLPPPPSPGNVSGIIPDTEPGCNYYLRVVSTSPSVVGTVWGPFCIQRCDVTTNEMQDISFCITECSADPSGESEVILLNTNTNNQTVTYAPGNTFTTQLLSSMDFSQIGPDGILGEVIATQDDFLTITIPCLEDALAAGIPTGMNYLRVLATNPSDPNNAVSTLIRVTIGVESSIPITISSYDFTISGWPEEDTLCAPASILLDFAPYDPADNSTYMWSCSGINGGAAFESPNGPTSNILLVTANMPSILDFYVQRTNYGCESPWSPIHSVVVSGPPLVFITGPPQICLGDTVSYQVPLTGSTYYAWSNTALSADIAFQDTSNNVLNIAFSSTGNYTLDLNVLNLCGAGSDSHTVTVVDLPEANAGPDMTICSGDEAILSLATGTSFNYSWASDAGNINNANNAAVIPSADTEYYGTVTTNLGCTDTDTVLVMLAFPDPPVNYSDSICPGGDNTIILEADSTGTYDWSTGSTDYYAEITDTGTYYLSVQTLFSTCPHFANFYITPTEPNPPVMLTDSVCPGGSEYIRLQADAPGVYEWNTGQTLPYINVNDPGVYIVTISGSNAPCPRTLHFTITPDTCIVIPPDTIPYEEIWAWVPNSFTLNNDGLNEVFGPVFSNPTLVRDYRFIIYDRWGNSVFSSSDPYEKWTGSFQNGLHYSADGIYNWQLFFRGEFEVNSKSSKGIVIVSR
ncbi:MAG: gliding motility-associated C-terminal domain-containing protein, partial [Flavobacteriales bacterium]